VPDGNVTVSPRVVDPSSSEETLCGDVQETEKVKPSVELRKAVPNSVAAPTVVKLQAMSDHGADRPTRLTLSPRKALRAVKSQAKSLGFS